MAKILITGGSGLLGKTISGLLIKNNHQPVWLSREAGESGGIKKYRWDLSKGYIDEKAFENVEAVIHLAGAGIADKRWTEHYKQEIIASRTKSSALLFDYISKNNYPVKTLVGGSATGYYGTNKGDHAAQENDPAGKDFLADTCVLWEKSYLPFANAGIRTAIIRTGIVLSNQGGAYPKMVLPFKLGLGAAIGSGTQYFPWVHVHDMAFIFMHALFNEKLSGPYNGAASEAVNNKQFSAHLAKSYHKSFFLPNVPAGILNLVMGESAMMVTEGCKISNAKIKETGFKFKFENLDEALKDLALNKAT